MTTAQDIIKRSLRLLGVYGAGEQLAPEEAQDGLAALNALVQSLPLSSQMVFAKSLDSIALSAGTAAYTVGPSGSTVTTRPVTVLDESYVTLGDVSHPLRALTLQQYNEIPNKALQGIPSRMWVQADMPDVTVTLWPVPSDAMTLKLWSHKQLTGTLALTTELALPPGYERMLPAALCEDIAAEYQKPVPLSVAQLAAKMRRQIARVNLQVPELDAMPDISGRRAGDFTVLA